MQDLPRLARDVFSDDEDGEDAVDYDDVFMFPLGMTELVCKLLSCPKSLSAIYSPLCVRLPSWNS